MENQEKAGKFEIERSGNTLTITYTYTDGVSGSSLIISSIVNVPKKYTLIGDFTICGYKRGKEMIAFTQVINNESGERETLALVKIKTVYKFITGVPPIDVHHVAIDTVRFNAGVMVFPDDADERGKTKIKWLRNQGDKVINFSEINPTRILIQKSKKGVFEKMVCVLTMDTFNGSFHQLIFERNKNSKWMYLRKNIISVSPKVSNLRLSVSGLKTSGVISSVVKKAS